MKYTVQKMDGRFSYRKWFDYCIGFTNIMSDRQGPLYFNQALKWFTNSYGWSAEIRQYANMKQWTDIHRHLQKLPIGTQKLDIVEYSDICNSKWSWTNGSSDLRIYVATDAELSFFCLAHPVDQK